MADQTPDVSGKWVPNSGYFKQSFQKYGQSTAKLQASGGYINQELQEVERLFDFSAIGPNSSSREAMGIERLWNAGNLAYGAEFYLFDNAADVGPMVAKLVAGGKKAKVARKAATISLRAKWHSTTAEYRNFSYNGRTTGDEYAGWFECYDPRTFEIVRQNINEARDWSQKLRREIRDYWRAYADAAMYKQIEHEGGFDSIETFIAKVMYSAALLREKRLPLELIAAIHLRFVDEAAAMEILGEFDADTKLSDYNMHALKTLYS